MQAIFGCVGGVLFLLATLLFSVIGTLADAIIAWWHYR